MVRPRKEGNPTITENVRKLIKHLLRCNAYETEKCDVTLFMYVVVLT